MKEKQTIIFSYDDGNAYIIAEDSRQALIFIWNERIHGYNGSVDYVRRDDGSYSWDDIYCLAVNSTSGDSWLNAKDNARAVLAQIILDENGTDIENEYFVDSAEEAIDNYINTLRYQGKDLLFDSSGNLI